MVDVVLVLVAAAADRAGGLLVGQLRGVGALRLHPRPSGAGCSVLGAAAWARRLRRAEQGLPTLSVCGCSDGRAGDESGIIRRGSGRHYQRLLWDMHAP